MKKINLNESAYNKLVNEISYGTVTNAYDINNDMFQDMIFAFGDFYDSIENIESPFKEFRDALYQNRNFDIYHLDKNNPFLNKIHSLNVAIGNNLSKIKEYVEEIKKILDRKGNQSKNFDNEILKADTNADWTEDNNKKQIRDLQGI